MMFTQGIQDAPRTIQHRKLFQEIAGTLAHMRFLEDSTILQPNKRREAVANARDKLEQLEKLLPSGSGVDNGTQLLHDLSGVNRLVFDFSFHHMNDHGSYTRWTDHRLIMTPSFDSDGFKMRITGADYRQVKDYLYSLFHSVLTAKVVQQEGGVYNLMF